MKAFKLLLVDDEPGNLQLLNHILGNDYDLIFATNGKDALQRAFESEPDLILLDVMMPGMSGYEVCEKLKSDHLIQNIPVIFLTSLSDEKDESKGFELGATDYISKPLRATILRHRIKNHLQLFEQKKSCEIMVQQRTSELLDIRYKSLQMLGRAAEYRDNETGMHIARMSHYSLLLAQTCGWNDSHQQLILNASAMHDVGKIGIADNILLKPGKLDNNEWIEMKKHPQIGATIIQQAGQGIDLFDMAQEIALSHHEKWNGSGYPKGLKGKEIPESARIVAIADVFDALTTARPYKKAWPVDKAIDLLEKEKGEHFDPHLIPLFLNIMPEILKTREKFKEQDV